jgi:hypothetical protein
MLLNYTVFSKVPLYIVLLIPFDPRKEPFVFETLEDGLTLQLISVFVKKEILQGNPAADTDMFPPIKPNPLIKRFYPPET